MRRVLLFDPLSLGSSGSPLYARLIPSEMSVVKDYLEKLESCRKIYGSRLIVLYQVGKFFENYDVSDDPKQMKNNTVEIAKKFRYNIGYKSDHILIGFTLDVAKKHIEQFLEHDYIVVTYVEKMGSHRKLVRVLANVYTPSTYIESDGVSSSRGILVTYIVDKTLGLAYFDVNTGSVKIYETYKESDLLLYSNLQHHIETLRPREILTNSSENLFGEYRKRVIAVSKQFLSQSYQDTLLCKVYNLKLTPPMTSFEKLGLIHQRESLVALVMLFDYIYKTNETHLQGIQHPTLLQDVTSLETSNSALYQLNVLSRFSNEPSLIKIIDQTQTDMGSRLLLSRLSQPSVEPSVLRRRYSLVEETIKTGPPEVRDIDDVQKLTKRLQMKSLPPQHLKRLIVSLKKCIKLIESLNPTIIRKLQAGYRCPFPDVIETCKDFIDRVNKMFHLKALEIGIDISVFKEGIDGQIDEIKKKLRDKEKVTEELMARLNDLFSGASTKKNVKAVSLIFRPNTGYYLKVTKSRWSKIEPHLNDEEKASFVNLPCRVKTEVRLTCPMLATFNEELKEDDIANTLNIKYNEYLSSIPKRETKKIQYLSRIIAEIDVYSSLAKVSKKRGYTKPKIVDSDSSFIKTKDLRHPIIEAINDRVEYVPNDFSIGRKTSGLLLYGLNSVGKSSFIKAVALNIFLAQMGSFVAARDFTFYPFKRVLVRISYNDDIQRGLSSYAVELLDIQNILQYSDSFSLVIGDEPCKSTETIAATSLVAQLCKTLSEKKCCFLFTTHLQPLAQLDEIRKLKTVSIKHLSSKYDGVTKHERKLKDGPGETTYGIECAQEYLDKEFINGCYQIRAKLMGKKELVSTKRSRYNKNVYMDTCSKCGKQATDTHHVAHQADADENGLIDGRIRLHAEHNLLTLCKDCHIEEHEPSEANRT